MQDFYNQNKQTVLSSLRDFADAYYMGRTRKRKYRLAYNDAFEYVILEFPAVKSIQVSFSEESYVVFAEKTTATVKSVDDLIDYLLSLFKFPQVKAKLDILRAERKTEFGEPENSLDVETKP